MRALSYRDKDAVPGARPDPRAAGGFEHPALPSQLYDEYHFQELTPEEKLHLVSLLQCVEDWRDLFDKGNVGNSKWRNFSREDALTLADFLFSDSYGEGDECFIPLREICKALCIDIHRFRAALSKIGTEAELRKLPLPTEEQLAARRHGWKHSTVRKPRRRKAA